MKHSLFLLIIVTLLFSCKKDPAPVVELSLFWGEASATINGKFWTAQPTAAINFNHGHGWDIEIDSFDSGILRQVLGI